MKLFAWLRRPVVVLVGPLPTLQPSQLRWGLRGEGTRRLHLMCATFYPYGFKTQKYLADIQQDVDERTDAMNQHLEAAHQLAEDISVLEKALPRKDATDGKENQ